MDLYERWLGIPPDRRPPTHYDLLGLEPFESDPETIEQNYLRRMNRVKQHELGPHTDQSQQILTELARARNVLGDPDRRADYDETLRERGQSRSAPASIPVNGENADANGPHAESLDASPDVLASIAIGRPEVDDSFALRPTRRRSRSILSRVLEIAFYLSPSLILLPVGYVIVTDPWNWRKPAPVVVEATPPRPAQTVPAKDTRRPMLHSHGVEPRLRGKEMREFDGTTRVAIALPVWFNMTDRSYTIFARIKTDRGGIVFSRTRENTWAPDGKALIVRDGKLVFAFGADPPFETPRQVVDGEWRAVTMTYKRDTHRIELYVDGIAKGGTDLELSESDNEHVVRIGYAPTDFPHGQNYFKGQISDARFYQRALSDSEIASLAKTEPSGDLLVARWLFDSIDSATIPDETGNGHEGMVEVAQPAGAPGRVEIAEFVDPVGASSRNLGGGDSPPTGSSFGDAATAALAAERVESREEKRPQDILASYGLRQAGEFYILKSEDDVVEAARSTRRLFSTWKVTQLQQQATMSPQAFAQMIKELDARINELKQELEYYIQQMNQLPKFEGRFINSLVREENLRLRVMQAQSRTELEEANGVYNQLKTEPFDSQARNQIDGLVAANSAAYIQARDEFDKRVEQTKRKYAELAGYAEVKIALNAIESTANTKRKLKTVREFEMTVKKLHERPPKKKVATRAGS